MTWHDIINAVPDSDTITVANAVGGEILFDRKKAKDIIKTPLYQVMKPDMCHVYKMEIGSCFKDLIIKIAKGY